MTREDLLNLVSTTRERWRPMVMIGAFLGLRINEIANLRVSSVNFLARTLSVETQLAWVPEHDPHAIMKSKAIDKRPKSKAAVRTLAVPLSIIEALAAHVARYGLQADDRLFTSVTGRPLRSGGFTEREWKRVRQACGFPTLHFHDLRHVAATLMDEAMIPSKVRQARMGHTSDRMTNLYTHSTEAGDRLAAELLETFLSPDSSTLRHIGQGHVITPELGSNLRS